MKNIHYLKAAVSAHQLNDKLFKELNWREAVVRKTKNGLVRGRQTLGFGNAPFEYAGKYMDPDPWESLPGLINIKEECEDLASIMYKKNVEFSFCLCGYYGEDGKGIPHHSDTVPTLDDIVVSVSFGAPRVFVWREYQNFIKEKTNTSDIFIKENFVKKETHYILEHGDVIMFDGHSQMKCTHAVSDCPLAGERINLTFRSGI
jgi:alkylated DNA repair dioxygenase AlkB